MWECHARPASLGGFKCGYFNKVGITGGPQQALCCEKCGSTKKASDDRKEEKSGKRR